VDFVVIVSADGEWRGVRTLFAGVDLARTPYGECFDLVSGTWRGVVLHGGWGKIDAAGSAQYSISRWTPRVIVNLGTCGGIAGTIGEHDTVLAERTIVYDIEERIGNAEEAIEAYTTIIDLSWLGARPLPSPARRVTLLSADRDLDPADVPSLLRLYKASAVDWESGAIARVAARSGTRTVILRTVSDLVGHHAASDAYGRTDVFEDRARRIMRELFNVLPSWLDAALGPPRTPPTPPRRTPAPAPDR
jgi:adenosylhomocysteine nucleosidase